MPSLLQTGPVCCRPQHFVGVNSKLDSCVCLNFGQLTQMTFQNGSRGQLATANPPTLIRGSTASLPPPLRQHSPWGLLAGPDKSQKEGARTNSPQLCWVLWNAGEDLIYLPQAHPALGPEPSPASENCLGKLTQWSFQSLRRGRATLERRLLTFHSQNLAAPHCTLATACLHYDLGLPTNSKYAPCLGLCNICYYCKKHLNYKGPGRSTENWGWSLISSNMVIQGVLVAVN